MKIKVLIADDHDLIRKGLRSIISFEEDIIIVGEVENGEKVLELLKLHEIDVILLDLNMPLLNGMKVIELAKKSNSDLKIIVITVENDSKVIHEAINIGADGYVLKDSAGTEIVDAIRSVYKGGKYIDKSLVATLFSDIRSKMDKTSNVLDILSKREVEVLLNISKGLSNKEIGQELFLSEKTVKNYTTNLFRKLTTRDRVHATIIALDSNIADYYKSKYDSNE
ncbi:MAG: response regulator transcription factor [Clostridiaceae bacterium]|nr:response regulator transcription factor [Clostridiaceae bacterium]